MKKEVKIMSISIKKKIYDEFVKICRENNRSISEVTESIMFSFINDYHDGLIKFIDPIQRLKEETEKAEKNIEKLKEENDKLTKKLKEVSPK